MNNEIVCRCKICKEPVIKGEMSEHVNTHVDAERPDAGRANSLHLELFMKYYEKCYYG